MGVSIGIVGLGLIGGSIAKSIRENTEHHIIGFDVQREVMIKAHSQGVIHDCAEDVEKMLGASDIVFLCLYPFETVEFIKQHYNAFKENAIVTDTAGLKGDLVKFYSKLTHNDKNIEFIGGHPMAGSEKSGFDFSTSHLFKGATYILTPHRGNSENAVEKIRILAEEMGFDKVTCMEAEKHDEVIAYTSHLPHIIASLLLKNKPSEALSGGSFRDATRVGEMNKSLWMELLMNNQINIARTLENFEMEIHAVRNAINSKNEDALSGLITLI